MEMQKSWYVMRTKPRMEVKAIEQVIKKSIEIYFPTYEEIRQWSDRRRKITIPLFSGYVFVYGTENERLNAIKENPWAMGYLRYLKRPAIVTEREIESIRISLKAPERIKIEKNTVTEGDLVLVTDGPFKGLSGYIIEVRGNFKILVNILEFGYSLNVELLPSEIQIQSIEN